METSSKQSQLHQDPQELMDKPVAHTGRRRFINGVGVAVPLLLTVRSRSVLATGSGGRCLAPSATASIALLNSRPDRQQLFCRGRTPGFWKNAKDTHPSIWYSVQNPEEKFATVFGSGFPGKTLRQVMKLTGGEDAWKLGAHLCAAYLDLKMGWIPNDVLTLAVLREMWAGRYGSFEPTAGVTWNGEQIVAYLQTTMPV